MGSGGPVSPLSSAKEKHTGKGHSPQMHTPHSHWSLMWWFGSLCVIAGALVSCIDEILSLEWIDALEMAYFVLMGILMAIVDTPFFNSSALFTHIHQGVNRFLAILIRVTGKGVVFMFLGCTLFSSMWNNLEGVVNEALALFLGPTIVLIGLISVLIGLVKSRNLNAVRTALGRNEDLQQVYARFARSNPNTGLTADEFEKLSLALPQQVTFGSNDMMFVFGAISSDPSRMFISENDLTQWVRGGLIFI